MERICVLFICTHNSARSQMAEGYLNARYGVRYEAFSAGTEATQVHPLAIAAMKESGIDISGHRSKVLDEFFGKGIDVVVLSSTLLLWAKPGFSHPMEAKIFFFNRMTA
jgi:protein-tyrosine-phosphatase